MERKLQLIPFFEGYVRNFRRMNLINDHNRSMKTKREIDYFANLGEMLGFDSFIEDSKFDKVQGRSRPMDLSWWKWDQRIEKDNYAYLALHLERESQWNKDEDTIQKLFSETEEGYVPQNVIGIQYVRSGDRIKYLNDLVESKNTIQGSHVLMVYRYYDEELQLERVCAFYFDQSGMKEERQVICKQDELGYWFMCFEEEYTFGKKEEGL